MITLAGRAATDHDDDRTTRIDEIEAVAGPIGEVTRLRTLDQFLNDQDAAAQ